MIMRFMAFCGVALEGLYPPPPHPPPPFRVQNSINYDMTWRSTNKTRSHIQFIFDFLRTIHLGHEKKSSFFFFLMFLQRLILDSWDGVDPFLSHACQVRAITEISVSLTCTLWVLYSKSENGDDVYFHTLLACRVVQDFYNVPFGFSRVHISQLLIYVFFSF